MSKIFPVLQPKSSFFRNGLGLVSSTVLAGLLAIDRSIARHREEAMLRALDRRLLEDIGFEPAPTVESKPDHASRSDFASLRVLFGWTRFVN
jgi:hypothetical protein